MTSQAFARTAKECPLAGALAERMRRVRHDLALQWLKRIHERVAISPDRIFPTSELLDHVPLLIEGIAGYIEDPADEVAADAPVVRHSMNLGSLRHNQGFDAYEILKEYEILGGILFNYLANAADEMPEPCEKSELLVCGHRLFRAVEIIQQTTTTHFLRLADQKVSEREDRLRAFNRAVSHEIKNRIGTILGAAEALGLTPDMPIEQRERFREIVLRNARAMKATVDNLVELARSEKDVRQHRHVRLPEAVQEVRRQLRESAQAARVAVVVAPDIPDVEVNAAIVELSLTNYLGNAIKYSNAKAASPRVEISARVEETVSGRELVFRVTDNGLGVPPEKRDKLFERYFRAHETMDEMEGTGLGLSIVRETVESIGGRAWAEFPEVGSVFAFAIPFRRDEGADRRQSKPAEEQQVAETRLTK